MKFLRACFVALLASAAALAPLRAGILEDRGIEDAINRSVIFQEVLIDRSMVRLYIRYGLVEMRGQVADERERDLLTYFISALPEVKQVDNRLFVDSAERRGTDRWRAIRLRSLLTMQEGIDVSRTKIAFANGRWQLEGEVSDEATRAAVAQRLRNLTPSNPLPDALTLSSASPVRKFSADDASIAAMVRSALESFTTLDLTEPQIACRLGKVVLRGVVPSEANRERATQIASATRGVVAVTNELSVRP